MTEYVLIVSEPIRFQLSLSASCADDAVVLARTNMHYHRLTFGQVICRVDGRECTICTIRISDDIQCKYPKPDRYVKKKCNECPYNCL